MDTENTQRGGRIPTNKKVVGELGENRIIFMEDYVRSFIQSVEVDEYDEGRAGLLLGDIVEEEGKSYVLIKGATEVSNAAVFKDKIAFTEETWPIANGTVHQYFRGMQIVGWYLVSAQITEEDLPVIREADRESFSEEEKVFYYYNFETDEEAFYEKGRIGRKKTPELIKSPGYACFYERNEAMQTYSQTIRQDIDYLEVGDENESGETDLRDIVKEPKELTPKTVKHHLTMVYALSMVLIIVVLVIGINSISGLEDGSNVKEEETTVGYLLQTEAETGETGTGEPESGDTGETESVTGETETEEATTEEATTEEPTTEEPTTEKPTTESPSYETYTVVSGDTLYGIAQKFYGSQSSIYVKGIQEMNNLGSNGIDIGQTLKIPSKEWCESR